MNRFIKYVLYIILFFIALIISTEFLFRSFKTSIDVKFEYFDNKENCNILFIGNSHIGAIGQPYDSSFNFSIGGQDIFHMLAIIKTITSKRNKINTMIIGVDYDLLGYDYKTANQMWLDRSYYKNTGILYDSSFVNKMLAQSNFFLANRNFKYVKIIKGKSLLTQLNIDNVEVKSDCRNRAEEHSLIKYDTALISKNIEFLQQIIDVCRSKSIDLTIINPPKTTCYYKYYNTVALTNGIKYINLLLEKNKHVHYYDFWKDQTFNDSDFLDNDHLNSTGADKLLQIILK